MPTIQLRTTTRELTRTIDSLITMYKRIWIVDGRVEIVGGIVEVEVGG